MTGIYAIINTPEPVQIPYATPCPPALAMIRHRCYIGQAKDFERRWNKDHVPYLRNGLHCCKSLLQAWQRDGRHAQLSRTTSGRMPGRMLGPFEFRVLEEVPEALLTVTERRYHAANVGGYRGSKR